jgi:hypothetical protein
MEHPGSFLVGVHVNSAIKECMKKTGSGTNLNSLLSAFSLFRLHLSHPSSYAKNANIYL